MFGRPPKIYVTEKERRDDLHDTLRELGSFIVLFLIAGGFFIWLDGGLNSAFYAMLLLAGVLLIPFVLVLLDWIKLQRKDRGDK